MDLSFASLRQMFKMDLNGSLHPLVTTEAVDVFEERVETRMSGGKIGRDYTLHWESPSEIDVCRSLHRAFQVVQEGGSICEGERCLSKFTFKW